MDVGFTDLCRTFIGITILQIFKQDVVSAENCYVGYNFGYSYYGYSFSCYGSITCEYGCCENGCCSSPYNRRSLALGLIFGLIGLILFCSGLVICFIQYVYRNKKKVTTRDSYAQTGDPNRGTVMAPTPLPPTFLLQKKTEKKKDNGETKVAMDKKENNESEKK